MLDSQGQRVLTIGSKGKAPFWDQGPSGITTDGKGNVYVASAHKVQKFNRRGKMVKSVGKKGRKVRTQRVSNTTSTKSMCVTAPMAESRCLTPI